MDIGASRVNASNFRSVDKNPKVIVTQLSSTLLWLCCTAAAMFKILQRNFSYAHSTQN